MTWTDLDEMGSGKEEYTAQARQKQIDLAKLYHRVFRTEDGLKVLEHLTTRYVINNTTSFNSPNIEYEAGYHAGEAGIVRMILQNITVAEEL